MKKHKIQHVIKKQGGNAQVVFRDGETVFWPREHMRGIVPGVAILEYVNKSGKTVAFSWQDKMRYVVPEPPHFDEAMDFIENLKWLDRIMFNNAVSHALDSKMEMMFSPNTIQLAHNMMLLKIKTDRYKTR